MLGYGIKTPAQWLIKEDFVKQMWGTREDELKRSIIAGVAGSAITFGVAAYPVWHSRPKALLPSAIGAILNIIGWSIVGGIKYVTFIKKDMDVWRTNYWGVDYFIHQDFKTGRFQVRIRAPKGRDPDFIVAYLTNESQRFGMKDASNESRWLASTITKEKEQLIIANRRATEDGRPVLDTNGNVIQYGAKSGLFGSMNKVIAVDDNNQPVLMARKEAVGYTLLRKIAEQWVSCGYYFNESDANEAIDSLMLSQVEREGRRSGSPYSIQKYVMQSAG
jgi:hypothetical protein